jgi:K+-sensing histidine kinase KdpD
MQQHIITVTVGPQTVTAARIAVAERLMKAGIQARSAFLDVVLLAVSELVTNVVRHAPHSLVTDIGISLGAGDLVIGVEDAEPMLPSLSGDGVGSGLAVVRELVSDYDGGLGAQPAADHAGKIVFVRFRIPA